jgi:hypothetical protein
LKHRAHAAPGKLSEPEFFEPFRQPQETVPKPKFWNSLLFLWKIPSHAETGSPRLRTKAPETTTSIPEIITRTLETKTGALEIIIRSLEIKTRALETKKRTLEIKKRTLEIKKRTLEMKKRTLEPTISHARALLCGVTDPICGGIVGISGIIYAICSGETQMSGVARGRRGGNGSYPADTPARVSRNRKEAFNQPPGGPGGGKNTGPSGGPSHVFSTATPLSPFADLFSASNRELPHRRASFRSPTGF